MACSTSVPAAGAEGESTVAQQISGLLKDKAIALAELDMLYRYTFGFSIDDALHSAGFQGTLVDFLNKTKGLAQSGGFASTTPDVDAADNVEKNQEEHSD